MIEAEPKPIIQLSPEQVMSATRLASLVEKYHRFDNLIRPVTPPEGNMFWTNGEKHTDLYHITPRVVFGTYLMIESDRKFLESEGLGGVAEEIIEATTQAYDRA